MTESSIPISASHNSPALVFGETLQDMFGRPIESLHPLTAEVGNVEYLSAHPTQPLDLCPNAVGRMKVLLALPGEEVHDVPMIQITEPTEGFHTTTVIATGQEGLYIERVTQEQADYDGQFETTPDGLPWGRIPLNRPVVEKRNLDPDEADVLLGWINTIKPVPRPRPVSLANVARLSTEPSEYSAGDMSDADKLRLATANIMHTVEASDFTGTKMLFLQPTEDAAELTSAQGITIFEEDNARSAEDATRIHMSSNRRGMIEDVTVYPENGRVYMQRGPRAIPASKYHMAIQGHILMSGISPGRPGLAPLELNPRQVDGVVEMITGAVPDLHPYGEVPKRWDEL